METVLPSFTVVVSCGLQDSLSSAVLMVTIWDVGFMSMHNLMAAFIIYIFRSFHGSFQNACLNAFCLQEGEKPLTPRTQRRRLAVCVSPFKGKMTL